MCKRFIFIILSLFVNSSLLAFEGFYEIRKYTPPKTTTDSSSYFGTEGGVSRDITNKSTDEYENIEIDDFIYQQYKIFYTYSNFKTTTYSGGLITYSSTYHVFSLDYRLNPAPNIANSTLLGYEYKRSINLIFEWLQPYGAFTISPFGYSSNNQYSATTGYKLGLILLSKKSFYIDLSYKLDIEAYADIVDNIPVDNGNLLLFVKDGFSIGLAKSF
jgi:hypothetical protein